MSQLIKRADLDAILSIGAQMSNVCYNASQDSRIPEHYRRSMKELQQEWDAARPIVRPRAKRKAK